MRYSHMLILIGAAVCCVWAEPKCVGAQDAPFSFDPPVYDPYGAITARPESHAGPTTAPSESAAVDAPAEIPIYGCACGCGVFEVGTRSMLPEGAGLTVYLEYDYQDQNINWSGVKPASSANNDDKEIRTNFFTAGVQYMINRDWGVQVEVPVDNRFFETTGGATGSDIVRLNWTTLGDIRVMGIYDGFMPDQSLGITFGTKLPTGSFTHNDAYGDIDRDSELGTGSTDVLLGGFYRNNLTADGRFDWFGQISADLPVLTQQHYRPGDEVDGSVGAYMNGLHIGKVAIVPIAQVIASHRESDSGINSANPVASGYDRILLSPGLEVDLHPLMFYADIELPVYARFTGDQLVTAALFKAMVSYHF